MNVTCQYMDTKARCCPSSKQGSMHLFLMQFCEIIARVIYEWTNEKAGEREKQEARESGEWRDSEGEKWYIRFIISAQLWQQGRLSLQEKNGLCLGHTDEGNRSYSSANGSHKLQNNCRTISKNETCNRAQSNIPVQYNIVQWAQEPME